MDLERKVAKQLEAKGYNIFYRNLCISLPNKLLLTEYDIVCKDFIIEVKSGNEISTKCNQIKNQVALLPKGFKLYYYCPYIDCKNIIQYNKKSNNSNELVVYTNTLDIIYRNHKPNNECNVKTQREFTKFLAYSIDKLKQFTNVYVTKETFYYTYLCITCINDHYSTEDETIVYSSEKIKYLVDNNIIKMVETFDDNIPSFVVDNPKNTIYVNEICSIKPINFKLCYYIDWRTVKLRPVDLFNELPVIEGITRYCQCCNKSIIFNKQLCCSRCYLHLRSQR